MKVTLPLAPYPSNAVVVPSPYDVSGNPNPTQNAVAYPLETTTLILPQPDHGWVPGTDASLDSGVQPSRVPRLAPTRESAGIRFASNRDEIGERTADNVYLPLPRIPLATAQRTNVRGGFPVFSNDGHVPAIFVGGDAFGGTNPE